MVGVSVGSSKIFNGIMKLELKLKLIGLAVLVLAAFGLISLIVLVIKLFI